MNTLPVKYLFSGHTNILPKTFTNGGSKDISIKYASSCIRNASSKPITNGEIQPIVYNRNPRNLERLRLERKPTGYGLEHKNVEYWHKLEVLKGFQSVTAQLVHNSNKVVVQASTKEWAIRQYLYSANDKQAYIVLAKVFAERCMESGFTTFANGIISSDSPNIQAFLATLEKEGIDFNEPSYYNVHQIWYNIEKKPWTVVED